MTQKPTKPRFKKGEEEWWEEEESRRGDKTYQKKEKKKEKKEREIKNWKKCNSKLRDDRKNESRKVVDMAQLEII